MDATPFRANPTLANAHLGWLHTVRSEWVKFRTIRSTYVILAIAAVLLVGFWSIIAFGLSEAIGSNEAPRALNSVAIMVCFQSIAFAQLAIGVLGVTFVTNEYSSGMARATFAAVPTRLPVLVAKCVVLVIATIVVMLPALAIAFTISRSLLGDAAGTWTLTDPEIMRALGGASLYLAVVALIGAVFGWLLRSAAGGIFTLVAVLILLPVILPLINLDWVNTLVPYLPSRAGAAVYQINVALPPGISPEVQDFTDSQSEFEPWTGFAIFAAYAIVGLIVSAVLLKRRDA